MSNEKMIYKAISMVMLEIKHVAKNSFNQGQKFNFRGIDDLYNAVHASLAKHEVFTTSKIINAERIEKTAKNGGKITHTVLRVEYTFWANDGSHVSTEVEGEAMDYGDKSTAKALSMADKYALIQMFKIPTSDMPDADKESYIVESSKKISDEVASEIKNRIKSAGIEKSMFLSWLDKQHIRSIDEIPEDKYSIVNAMIQKKESQNV